jgi:four helix bundle protein
MSERLLLFADRVLYIAEDLPSARGVGKVREQIVASGTSIGANYEEADGAETRADKKKSLVTSRKEARESRWWLRLINLHWKQHIDVKADIAEATELILILSRMIQLTQP